MGSTVPAPANDDGATLVARVIAPNPLARIDLVRNGEVAATFDAAGARAATVQRTLTGLRAGEYVYVRAVQGDAGAAWSSPIFIE